MRLSSGLPSTESLLRKQFNIQKGNKSYFAYVLTRDEALDYHNRKPTNLVLAQATLSTGKKGDQKKALEMSFSSINKELYPPGPLKDL